MDVRFGESLSGFSHKFLHEIVILFPTDSRLSKTKVYLILEQVFILHMLVGALVLNSGVPYICATIQHHRQLSQWMDTSTQGGDHQLGDGNLNRTHSLVSNPEDLHYMERLINHARQIQIKEHSLLHHH